MNKLIRLEFRKLFQSKSLYICFAVGLLFISTSILLYCIMNKTLASVMYYNDFILDILTLRMLLSVLIYILPIIPIGTMIFIPMYVCADLKSGVIKNIISKGYSNSQIMAAKYIVSLIVVVSACIITLFFGFIYGGSMLGYNINWNAKLFLSLFVPILNMIVISSLSFCSVSVIRKNIAILINFIFPIVFFRMTYYLVTFIVPANYLVNIHPFGSMESLMCNGIISLVFFTIFTVVSMLFSRKAEV